MATFDKVRYAAAIDTEASLVADEIAAKYPATTPNLVRHILMLAFTRGCIFGAAQVRTAIEEINNGQ
jgi:hypothetical protein